MFSPAHVDANIVYLNDRMNPDLSAVGVAGCRLPRKKVYFSFKSDLRCHYWTTNSIVHRHLLIFVSYTAWLHRTFS